MTRLLAPPYGETDTSGSGFEKLEVDFTGDFAEKIGSYSDLLLFRPALARAWARSARSMYSSVQETSNTMDMLNQTALTTDPILRNVRSTIETIISTLSSLISERRDSVDYLFEDEPPAEIIPKALSRIRVVTKDDVDLPWA
jgi:hypothetical protein